MSIVQTPPSRIGRMRLSIGHRQKAIKNTTRNAQRDLYEQCQAIAGLRPYLSRPLAR